MNSDIQALFYKLIQQGTISHTSLIGCNGKEIEFVVQHFGCELPLAYREFLMIAGKGAGKLFQGTDIFYPRVLQLQEEAAELLAELEQPTLLPADGKVFCMHQGYEINYFVPGHDDPPVFQFFEGQDLVTQPWPSLSEFIRSSIEDHLKQWKNLDRNNRGQTTIKDTK
jgi:hypothetical protein